MCFWCTIIFNDKTMVALILIFEQTSIVLNKHLPVEQNSSIICPRHVMCLLVFECVLPFSIMSYKMNIAYNSLQCYLNKLYGIK